MHEDERFPEAIALPGTVESGQGGLAWPEEAHVESPVASKLKAHFAGSP